MALRAFLELIRLPNLLIVIATQLVVYELIIKLWSVLEPLGLEGPAINYTDLFLLISLTLVATASGNIINDYMDWENDLSFGKKSDVYKAKWTKKTLWKIYQIFSIIYLFLMALFVFQTGLFIKSILFVFIYIALYVYSAYWKKQAFVGNLAVAVLSSMVVFVLYYFDKNLWPNITANWLEPVYMLGLIYMLFAFILSLARELVKDMEDLAGDRAFNLNTLPIVLGLPIAKFYYIVLLIFSISFLAYLLCQLYLAHFYYLVALGAMALLLPQIWLCENICKAKTKSHFKMHSKYLKIQMLFGLLILSGISYMFYLNGCFLCG